MQCHVMVFESNQTSYYNAVVPQCEGLEIKYVTTVCLVNLLHLNVLKDLIGKISGTH